MSNLSYLCKTCFPEKPTKLPRFCSCCFSRIKADYTRVQLASSSHTLPRNLRFCESCAPTYKDAQAKTDVILRSNRVKIYHGVETIASMPLALIILPTIIILGTPVYVIRKLYAAMENAYYAQ